jgi:hypothetical protein
MRPLRYVLFAVLMLLVASRSASAFVGAAFGL